MPEPLDPACIFAALSSAKVDYVLIGGLAAVLHGSTAMTNDADIVPDPEGANLVRLSTALRELGARLRSATDPDGVPFDPHPELLASVAILNMTTRCGDLDLTFAPSGTAGYGDLVQRAVPFKVGRRTVQVAALSDIIRSKEAAGRPKDHAVLPILYALEEEIGRLGT
ncbi:MAG TPA: hypothetical protein VD926_03265 [Acidimicrobiales bacterium]|nr:hypothetical protein [Acidimicrobiales bacterium]